MVPMEKLRPTFSESWYRVAELRAKLRASTQVSRQYYRGELWYVVRDPAGNQFHRLSAPAYRFVGLLDGTRTVTEAWDLVGGQLADDAPTQNEIIQILSQLHSANLLEADVSPDAAVLLRRHKRMMKRQWQGRMMNLLFPRIPLWDPDRFLQRWMPAVRPLLSWFGAAVWLVVVIWAILTILPRWSGPDGLMAAASRAIDVAGHPERAFFLWLSFVLIKAIHELGHAFACRRFGGEVHELGIMFLVFIPTPYVDASSAWGFPSKWARIFVGAAGMVIELFVAAVAAFVWANTGPGFIHDLAYNTMLIASVSTVLFNANPLLRYDGYYMLADWLEIPNLRYRSTEYSLGLIKRHLFRVKSPQPLPPPGQRLWLLLYAVLSGIYRVFVGLMIILIVWDRVPILGVLMALGGIVTWLVVPLFKTTKYLLLEPELHRKRPGAIAWTLGFVAACVAFIGFLRMPQNIQGTAVLESSRRQLLRAREEGFVTQILVQDGQTVTASQPILVCQAPRLTAALLTTRAEERRLQAKLEADLADPEKQAEALIDQAELRRVRRDLQRLETRAADLTIRAPFDGEVVAPRLDDLMGKYLQSGEEIATVYQPGSIQAPVALDRSDAQLLLMEPQFQIRVRLSSNVSQEIPGSLDPDFVVTAQRELEPALTQLGGGQFAADPRDPGGRRLAEPVFRVPVKLTVAGAACLPGQRAYVRFDLAKRPLWWQWKRKVLQLIQQHSHAQWL